MEEYKNLDYLSKPFSLIKNKKKNIGKGKLESQLKFNNYIPFLVGKFLDSQSLTVIHSSEEEWKSMNLFILNKEIMDGIERAFKGQKYWIGKGKMDKFNFWRAIFDLVNLEERKNANFNK